MSYGIHEDHQTGRRGQNRRARAQATQPKAWETLTKNHGDQAGDVLISRLRDQIVQRDKKKQIERIIFPRFHQLDVTRDILAAVLKDGVGGRYLIQHSAGSGKTNSIAWTAHFLADLHDAQGKKVFDTVIVVSDRRVIDSQLQDAIFDFKRTSGVVATIKGAYTSKSEELANSPDLNAELLNAIMGALDAHTLMSTQALNSKTIQQGLKNILLDHSRLWETLKSRG